ncbi:UNVERIFIED_CONTAM: hypothetical protein FKN15_076982 [Acipenser sinensis]
MTSSPGLLRILCVHGYRQNGSAFRERTGALRKALKKHAELVYITAPLRVTDPASQQEPAGGSQAVEPDSQTEDPRGWWFSNAQERSVHAGESCQSSLGLEESLEAVRRVVREQGPFDGILGFSQGAALVAMICALQGQAGDAQGPFSFRFAVLIAGFRSVCEEHARFYTTPVSMPTLHVFGETDRVIPDHMSRELVMGFQNPQVLTHTGGHFVPAAAPQKKVYCQFLDTFISK